jgi:hypothetical protein
VKLKILTEYVMGLEEYPEYHLDYVSHGNYAVHSKNYNAYINLEYDHFGDILNSFKSATVPSGRTPFWTGIVPPRGFYLEEYLVETYTNGQYIKFITSTCVESPFYHCQWNIPIPIFSMINDAVQEFNVGRQTMLAPKKLDNE